MPLLARPLDTPITLSSAFDSGTSLTRDAALALAHDANTELRVIDRQIKTQRARLALAGALRNPDVIPSAALTHALHRSSTTVGAQAWPSRFRSSQLTAPEWSWNKARSIN